MHHRRIRDDLHLYLCWLHVIIGMLRTGLLD